MNHQNQSGSSSSSSSSSSKLFDKLFNKRNKTKKSSNGGAHAGGLVSPGVGAVSDFLNDVDSNASGGGGGGYLHSGGSPTTPKHTPAPSPKTTNNDQFKFMFPPVSSQAPVTAAAMAPLLLTSSLAHSPATVSSSSALTPTSPTPQPTASGDSNLDHLMLNKIILSPFLSSIKEEDHRYNNNHNHNHNNTNGNNFLHSSSSADMRSVTLSPTSSLHSMNTTTTNSSNTSLSNMIGATGADSINIADVMHKLHVTTYLTPTYCDYCSQLLIGLIKQGLKCEICNQNFHKRCIQHMPKVCNKQLNQVLSKSPNSAKIQNNLLNELNAKTAIDIEHTFIKKHNYHSSSRGESASKTLKCDHCQLKIKSDEFYYNCKDCQINIHLKCVKNVKKNCKITTNAIEPDDESEVIMDETTGHTRTPSEIEERAEASWSNILKPGEERKMSCDEMSKSTAATGNSNENSPHAEVRMQTSGDIMETPIIEVKDENGHANDEAFESETIAEAPKSPFVEGNTPTRYYKHGPRMTKKKNQICLQRLSQRVKKTSEYFWSGHMFYYTNLNPEYVTHYWKLDSSCITIYDSYRLEKVIRQILLTDIRKANLYGLSAFGSSKDAAAATVALENANEQKCLFMITTDKEIYYCGMDNADQNSTMNVLARNFYNIFKMVFLPYCNRNGRSRQSFKITAPKYEEKSVNEEYIINPQELLGSGQFGQVYGGVCRANNQAVAIKVIDKSRFKDFYAETNIFQNEITILYNVQHPGIVRLFALFDEVDCLYIVTEKMATDMLEFILNKQPARLTERVSKFIIYQILCALHKLHDRNIAHCDLKPENILLAENVDYPQVKICDFGYAKIIGENSFRKSMVGTPAYSPPELKQKRLYNNSVDMWSMGVIVYVSLSGTFPFEEDRDIYEQIVNSNFLFPSDPWSSISTDAVDLIYHFLQVNINRRMSVNKALQHKWFSSDYTLYEDLVNLEKRLNLKWLTTKEQEEKWNQPISI